jgi:hypothetical protein
MSDLAITLQTSAINPDLGDLELSDSTRSEILLTDHPSYPAGRAVMQDVFIRLRFFFGEWFLDPTQGLPYFRYVFVQNPDMRLITSIFRRTILGTVGVASLDSLVIDRDAARRILYPKFVGRLVSGAKFTSADFGPFLIAV